MTRTLPAAVAKAHFSECLRDAEAGDAVFITRHGRPVVALVAAKDVVQLLRLRAAREGGGLASIAGQFNDDDVADAVDEIVRTRTGPRPIPDLA